MTKKLTFGIIALLLNFCTYAQTVVIGAGSQSGTASNGATGDPGPMYRSGSTSNFVYSTHHYLYTQAELSLAGFPIGSTITGLAWNKSNNAASNANFLFQIWLKNSSLTTVTPPPQTLAALTTGATAVYNSSATSLPATIGFINFPLSTPFIYTGGALEITVNFDMSSGTSPWTTDGVSWLKDPVTNSTLSYCGSTANTTLSNLRTVRPQLQITYSACNAPTGVNATTITQTSATIGWTAVSGSLGYEYIVDQNPGSPSGSGMSISGTSQSIPGLSSNTTYYFHIRNKCSTAFSNWVNYAFTTDDAYCKAPGNILFGNIGSKTADAMWSLVSTATSYDYYVDVTSVPPVAGNPGIKQTTNISAFLTGLSPDTKHYFFVRSVCLAGADSSVWKIDSFVTNKNCPMPDVQLFNVTNTAANAVWFRIPSAIAYEYAVTDNATTPAFGTPTTDTVATLVIDEHKKKQFVHVRAKCNSQFVFSDWYTEVLKDETSVPGYAEISSPAIYPNPVSGELFVAGAMNTHLTVTDVKGTVVKEADITTATYKMDCRALVPGLYILNMRSAAGISRVKFTKL